MCELYMLHFKPVHVYGPLTYWDSLVLIKVVRSFKGVCGIVVQEWVDVSVVEKTRRIDTKLTRTRSWNIFTLVSH